MKLSRKRLQSRIGKGIKPLSFQFRDEFVTTESAPVVSPRTCEPGPGTLTFVQLDGGYGISGGQLVTTPQSTPAWSDLGATFGPLTRSTGLALLTCGSVGQTSSPDYFGFKTTTAINYNNWADAWTQESVSYGLEPNNLTNQYRLFIPYPTNQIMGVVLRSLGAYYIIDDRLYFVSHLSSATPLYLGFLNRGNTITADYMRVAQLPAPFNTSNGLALHVSATPTNGETTTGLGDGSIYFTWTPAANEILNIRYRWIDDDNCMIIRCDQANSTIKMFRRWHGVETQRATATVTWTVAATNSVYVIYASDRTSAGKVVTTVAVPINGVVDGFQFDKTGVKIDGFTTGADFEVYPYHLDGAALHCWDRYSNPFHGGYRSQNIIDVPDGGNLTTAIATMRRGDILNLATNGTYTLTGSNNGIALLPNGFIDHRTEVRGNGSTIVNGNDGIVLNNTENFKISNLNFLNQSDRSHNFISCRNFDMTGCTFQSNGHAAFFDCTHFDHCKNFTVTDCKCLPSSGASSTDGFELYGECENGIFTNCEASGCQHGFEVWTGNAPVWINNNIQFINCNSHDNGGGGFSSEGGVVAQGQQGLSQQNIICINCQASNNDGSGGESPHADYRGVDGSTLYRKNSPGTTTGSVIDL